MQQLISCLIIGAGIVGERHAQAQIEEGLNVSIFDTDFQKAKTLAAKLGGTAKAYKTLSAALKTKPDLVHICSPDNAHIEPTLKALATGAHVLIEKPLTTSLKDADKLIQAAKKYPNQKIFVSHNYRFTPGVQEIKKHYDAGEIGKVERAYATYLHNMTQYRHQTPWRNQQNFLWGGGCHPIDLLIYIFGQVTSVKAELGLKKDPSYALPEEYLIYLTFKSGVKAFVWLNASIDVSPHGTDLIVMGDQATYITHSNKEHLVIQYSDEAQEEVVHSINSIMTIPALIHTLDEYLRSNRPDHQPIPLITETRHVIEVLDAVDRAIVAKKSVKI